jgi:tetratricopeptide (TPR) repeat protein
MKKTFKKQFALPKEIVTQVDVLSIEGDSLLEGGKYEAAAKKYIEAFRLLPNPKEQWEVAYWLIKFWGISYYKAKQYGAAINSFESALFYGGAETDAEVFLLLGKSYYLNGDKEKAKVNFKKALQIGGKEVFKGEDEYLNMVL